MSDSRASLLINGLGGGVLSCILFNNALSTVQTSRRKRRERRSRTKRSASLVGFPRLLQDPFGFPVAFAPHLR
jgi:hypothetical protein